MKYNIDYPTSDGYPNLKVYTVLQWYEQFYEFEISGEAVINDYEGFFQQLTNYNQSKFYNYVQNKRTFKDIDNNYRKAYQIRFISQSYNEEFIFALGKFLESIHNYIEPKFIVFGKGQDKLLELLNSLSITYRLRPIEDIHIEKIEWYWSGMHPTGSPKVRFDKLSGKCVMLGVAIGTPLYPEYREPMANWFSTYLDSAGENAVIKVKILLDYFDMISKELKNWTVLLLEKFKPNQIEFEWCFPKEKEETLQECYSYLPSGFESYLTVFQPFKTTHKVMNWEDFQEHIDKHYSSFKEV